jgi:hypothetical protein
MKCQFYFILFLVVVFSLHSFCQKSTKVTFEIKGNAKNKTYGYTPQNPIKVGGGAYAGYHFLFIKHLRGPNGDSLDVERIGSCYNYDNPDTTLTPYEKGVLTCFSFKCKAFKKPKVLYFDKYRYGDLYIPKNFTWID